MTRRRRSPNRPRRVDLIAQAERLLYPGVPWRRFTRAERCRTIALAKAHLLARGQWPVGPGERDELRLMRGAA
jgi:hypothetical protein